jgi:hypothetical protein
MNPGSGRAYRVGGRGAKNGYFNNRIFCGIVQAGGVPEFLGIRKTLVIQAHRV